MAETPDHSTHLKSLVEQQAALSRELETKKNLLMKVTGAIEYLKEIGVTLSPQNDSTPETTTESEEGSSYGSLLYSGGRVSTEQGKIFHHRKSSNLKDVDQGPRHAETFLASRRNMGHLEHVRLRDARPCLRSLLSKGSYSSSQLSFWCYRSYLCTLPKP